MGGGDEREPVVVVDDREPVSQRVWQSFQRREEPEVHGAFGHRGDRFVEQRLVLGHDRPDMNSCPVAQLDCAGLEPRRSHLI